MKYLKQYVMLMRKAQRRDPKELEGIYTEKHHIFPKSVYGNNKSVVRLTYKEHIVAHHLLAKAFIKRYGLKDKRTTSMVYAVAMFTDFVKKSSYKYGECPRVSSIISAIKSSKNLKRKSSGMKGKKHTPEAKLKMSRARKGYKRSQEAIEASRRSLIGRKLDENVKKKISDTLTGRPMDEYIKLKMVDHTLRDWVNFRTGEVELQITSYDLRKKYPNLLQTGVVEVTAGRHSHHHGWRLAKEGDLDNFDHLTQKYIIPPIIPSRVDLTKYDWHNREQGLYELNLTVIELSERYPYLNKRYLHLLKRGKIKSHQGWVVLKDQTNPPK